MFEIFLHYKEWQGKSKPQHYDMMDISNHILA
jgi:hypothetical protein